MIKHNINLDLNEYSPMMLRLQVDRETVLYKKADSFLINYMRQMRSFLAGEGHEISSQLVRAARASGTAVFSDSFKKVTAVNVVSGKLQLSVTSHGMSTGHIAYVMGVNGITGGDPNGFHAVTVISSSIIELTNLISLSGTHSEATSVAWIYTGISYGVNTRVQDETFGAPQVRVGDGTTANTISTESLEYEIPSGVSIGSGARSLNLVTTNPSVSTPSVGATKSTITLVQEFDNTSGATIGVEEIGIWAKFVDIIPNGHYYSMIVRDVLGGTVNVGNGQRLTVTYELNTDVPDTSNGILIQLHEMFYRQIAQTSREAKDIFNANQLKADNEGQFFCQSRGGTKPLAADILGASSLQNYLIGPRLGTSTTNVVNTNFRLQDGGAGNTAIEHGEATGELFHYGTYITDIQLSGTQISIEISRIFENRSGATITANECGLYVGYVTNFNLENVHCIARHLITAINILNGEFVKLTYTIAINV